jgi:hypothetical protein
MPPLQVAEAKRIGQGVTKTTLLWGIGAIFGVFFAFLVLLVRPPVLAAKPACPRAPEAPPTTHYISHHEGSGPGAGRGSLGTLWG